MTAAAVKQNLDAYRAGPLFGLVLSDVASVEIVDAATVRVRTAVPWVAFDAFLWSNGRLGILAPRQLANPETCATDPIGTGPFRFTSWRPNVELVAVRNPSYWRVDADGRRLPYLDRVTFRPIADPSARIRELERGGVDLTSTTDPTQILRLQRDAAARTVELTTTNAGADVNFVMLNMARPPFDQPIARVALARAIDIEKIIADTQHGLVARAVQPFSKGTIGYTDPKQVDLPAFDQRAARTLVRQYEQQVGHGLTFQLVVPDDPTSRRVGQLMKTQAEAAGMHVDLEVADTVSLTNAAVAGDFGAVLWRATPAATPTRSRSGGGPGCANGRSNAADFARIDDPELDRLLVDGRSEARSRHPSSHLRSGHRPIRAAGVQRVGLVHDISGRFRPPRAGTRSAHPGERSAARLPRRLPTGRRALETVINTWAAAVEIA